MLLAAANICSSYRIPIAPYAVYVFYFMFCSSAWATRTVALSLGTNVPFNAQLRLCENKIPFSPTCDVPSVSVSFEPKCGKMYTETEVDEDG